MIHIEPKKAFHLTLLVDGTYGGLHDDRSPSKRMYNLNGHKLGVFAQGGGVKLLHPRISEKQQI